MKTTFANLSKHQQKHENNLIQHQKTGKTLKIQYKHENPEKNFLDIKTPKNHPKSNITKSNFNHSWQVGHAKTSSKNPKTPFKNF